MAVYKVIQDIEAEDKLLGPLTLKSFVYALIAGGLAFIMFRIAISTVGDVKWGIVFVLLLPTLLFGVLAAPIGKDQPTEVWILSHVKFLIGSHKKIWDQAGYAELVTITAPKTLERRLTKDLTQDQVKSRLNALATTLDTRGWAVKNIAASLPIQPASTAYNDQASDRLIDAASLDAPQQVIDLHASDDIMDEQNNPTAQKFNAMIKEADQKRKSSILERFHLSSGGLDQPQTPVVTMQQKPLSSYERLTLEQQKYNYTSPDQLGDPSLRDKHPHFDTKPSLIEQRATQSSTQLMQKPAQQPADTMPSMKELEMAVLQNTANTTLQSVKMDLAKSNDLSVASVSKLVNNHESVRQISANEVEISLH